MLAAAVPHFASGADNDELFHSDLSFSGTFYASIVKLRPDDFLFSEIRIGPKPRDIRFIGPRKL
ncbi:hypothetical protein SDC9_209182 [bioreactor metagenome]|uniref:Uncharacterized protein n=1 Tax=bioreactor metagenome TaxID=1076179 RepID=A0A645JCJ9_9ZZZZ